MRIMARHVSRRRAITLTAAALMTPAASRAGMAAALTPFRWRGVALGATADLTLYAESRAQAVDVMAACLAEIERLEAIFSLHRPDSLLVRLNGDGFLAQPPAELVELLSLALRLGELSAGRFDPTIQPLWTLIADHFARPDADPAGPRPAALAAARDKVDHRFVRVGADRIAFARPGVQVTLNGIAQGYITDRVGALLRAHGFGPALVNLGEALAIERKPDGQAWRIGVRMPGDPTRLSEEIEIESGAVATSAGRGLLFDAGGRFNHIIDPTRLICADRDASVTVLASSAAVADGLSTLVAVLAVSAEDILPHLARFDARAYLVDPNGQGRWIG